MSQHNELEGRFLWHLECLKAAGVEVEIETKNERDHSGNAIMHWKVSLRTQFSARNDTGPDLYATFQKVLDQVQSSHAEAVKRVQEQDSALQGAFEPLKEG